MSAAPRSSFVTVVAWVFIVCAGFATLIAVMQNIMLALFMPFDVGRMVEQAERTRPMPGAMRFLIENFRLWVAAFLAISLLTLVSAIGLLRRRNWARLTFIGIMVFGVLWNLAGLVLMLVMPSLMPPLPDTAPRDFGREFDLMMKIIIAVNVAIALGVAVLFGWIIKRLGSADIRREFL
jgi:hypothetical protein